MARSHPRGISSLQKEEKERGTRGKEIFISTSITEPVDVKDTEGEERREIGD